MKDTPSSTLIKEPLLALFFILLGACSSQPNQDKIPNDSPYILVLGTAQDAGYPQAGENNEFQLLQKGQREKVYTVSLCLIDPLNKTRYLFEATPDFREQLNVADQYSKATHYPYDGIFLTHAHMGHYTGLMHLGFEAMSAQSTLVYAMPRMKAYLENNGPWSQLVNFKNIELKPLQDSTEVKLSNQISATPFTVPHRDEYSETVGFKIKVDNTSLVFIPDIDKWEKWDVDIKEVVKNNDYILIDASFYANGELPDRDMSAIPHPFTSESMELFGDLPAEDKAKVYFIHANHTNPILNSNSREFKEVEKQGFHVAQPEQIIKFK